MPTPIAYTIAGAISASGMSRTRLYALIGSEDISAIKVGRRTLIRSESLRRYIDTLPSAKIRKQKAA
jgi:hypothetical protein